ncbi:MAG: carboxypeptidase regulatory-like domain-containing protein [Planctomycetota bacterium]|jgi:hypothetical protein
MSKDKATDAARGRRNVLRIAAVLGLLFVMAAAILAYPYLPRSERIYTDANTIHSAKNTARIRKVLWTPPRALPALLSSGTEDYEPRISQDGTTLYFVRGKAGRNADIFVAAKTVDGWGEPQALEFVNTEYDELGPAPSADGQSLYFYSDRPGGQGGYDLWVAHKSLDGRSTFAEPINLGPRVNSPYSDYGPALTPENGFLYFSSNRPQPGEAPVTASDPWSATLREDFHHRDYDLFVAQLSESGPSAAKAVLSINTEANEGAPAISPVGDFLYLASDRSGGAGGFDLYRARLIDGVVQELEHLDVTVNTRANELDPALDMGGFGLYFSSDRLAEEGGDGPKSYSLFHSTSREVFADFEVRQAAFDWAAFWDQVGIGLLVALLSLLLMLLLIYLMQGVRGQRLSLLARCLLASMLLHLLLLFMLAIWEVSAGMASARRGDGRIHITLATPAAAGSIAQQVRGAMTEVAVPDVAEIADLHNESKVEVTAQFEAARLESSHRPVILANDSFARPELEQVVPAALVQIPELTLPRPKASNTDALEINIPENARLIRERESDSEVAETVQPQAATSRKTTVVVDVPADRPNEVVEELPVPVSATALARADSGKPLDVEIPDSDAADSVDQPMNLGDPASASLPAASTIEVEPMPLPESAIAEASETRIAAEPTNAGVPRRDVVVHVRPAQPVAASIVETDVEFSAPAATTLVETTTWEDIDPQSVALSSQLPDSMKLDEALRDAARQQVEVPALGETVPETTDDVDQPRSEPVAVTVDDHRRPSAGLIPVDELETDSTITLALADTLGKPVWDESMAKISLPGVDDPSLPVSEFGLPEDSSEEQDFAMPDLALDLLPSKPRAPSYAQRSPAARDQLVEDGGGSEETEHAVGLALQWLAEHQSPDGSWDGDGFDEGCEECGGETNAIVETGLTGLALLCFVAADHTHDVPGPYQQTVARAIDYLLEQQKGDGDLRGRETMYSHAIATIALAESLGMTKDDRLEAPVRRAIRFIDAARNRMEGGWRYDPGQPGDTSVLGWQVMAIKAARTAGLDVPWRSLDAARVWLDQVADGRRGGRYAYMPGREYSPSMTAESLFVRYLLGDAGDNQRTRESVRLLMSNLPSWEEEPNTYYWYYGTLALFQHGGAPWSTWNRAVTGELLDHQRSDGKARGSWDPVGRWAKVGGRVYQTAICALTLEVYYRYLPSFAKPIPHDAIGRIAGRVTDAECGEPLGSAAVRLDLSDREPVVVQTDENGRYELFPPPLPDFFAVSASRPGFLPRSENVARSWVAGSTLSLDFALEPENELTVAIEDEPRVHHLGDNEFSGKINSRFQRRAEGDTYEANFGLDSSQLDQGFKRAELTMLVKGVQMRHRLFVNGHLLDAFLEESPSNGSFGEFTIDLEVSYLQVGQNRFMLKASARGNDIDDFEFVNVQLRLIRD